MGVTLKGLYEPEDLELSNLKGKILAVDAHNILYQFLTTIRSYDGSQLMNSNGEVTSHIQGLFSRVIALMQRGVRLAFVFDGKPPALKDKTLAMRRGRKESARKKYDQALADEDTQAMHMYAKQTTVLTQPMVVQAKQLLTLLGIPCIDAPVEGEAQAAHMVKQGIADAVASQDADALLFGAPIVVRNISFSGKRKLPGQNRYVEVKPQRIDLPKVLDALGITQKQLIYLGMLVGTDYAPGGIKGIGPKKALAAVKEHGDNPETLFTHMKWGDHHDVSWQEVLHVFTHMEYNNNVRLTWQPVQYDDLYALLTKEFEFSSNRIEKSLETLKGYEKQAQQKGLGDFF